MGYAVDARARRRRANWTLWAAVAAAGVLTGCGSSARQDLNLNSMEAGDQARQAELAALFASPAEGWVYEIQAGDQLEVVFFTHPDQNRFVQVRPDGRITLPFAGELVAAGRPPTELASEIQSRYEEVLVKPRVDVIVQEMDAPFYIMGEVRSGGEKAYERELDLVQALAMAGGFTGEARLSNVVLLRKAPDGTGAAAILNFRSLMSDPDGPGNIKLRPYDVVWVPRDNISRFSNVTEKTFRSLLSAQEVVIKGWSLANFDEVFRRAAVTP